MEKKTYRYKELNELEKQQFIELYFEVANKQLLFNILRKSKLRMCVWVLHIILFCINSFKVSNQSFIINICVFILGIVALQIIFISSHINAHALFLEYENHVPKNSRMSNNIVYYYAFYHHHHTAFNNWAEFLSYYNDKGENNIAVAHWVSYSMVASFRVLIVLMFSYFNPLTLVYFSGYEIATILLPFAHKWQHISHNKENIFIKYIFSIFQLLGIVANIEDHKKHHMHNWPTVYQDFSSSGLYIKYIDKLLNKLWDSAFNQAFKNNKYVHDYTEPCSWLISGLFIFCIPLLLCLIQ
jgi:hypothetical protein